MLNSTDDYILQKTNKTVCTNKIVSLYILKNTDGLLVCLVVLNATFNNISVLSVRSVLMVEETGRPGENQRRVVHLTLI